MQPLDRQALAPRVIQGLRKTLSDATCALHFSNPLELIVATILSAQCTDERVNQVTSALFRNYRSAADYASVPQARLEDEIRPTGFFRQKATAIRSMAQMLVDKFGSSVPATMNDLIQLPGVARKTANVVLGTAFGIPSGIVVDTHVRRLSYRFGLTDESDPDKIERDLMAVIPRDDWIWFGHALIWHGRRVCTARAPSCEACFACAYCPRRGVGEPSRRSARRPQE
ncbi:MAG: endonuclease III [Chloroflexi bacterium]|nr:endonuclease III [Chloroflexota bacterium]